MLIWIVIITSILASIISVLKFESHRDIQTLFDKLRIFFKKFIEFFKKVESNHLLYNERGKILYKLGYKVRFFFTTNK